GDYYARRQYRFLLPGASRCGHPSTRVIRTPNQQQACPKADRPVFLQAVSILKGLFIWLRVILYEELQVTLWKFPW
ncbi:MAG: hypothetical protein R6W69_11950, partial [Anaerolineales bacterium]